MFNGLRIKITLLICTVCLLVLLTSCKVDNETTDTIEDIALVVPGVDSTTLSAAEVYHVVIDSNAFMPTSVEINVGDTIEWVNRDNRKHTVTFEKGILSEYLPGRGRIRHTFNEDGIFYYYCQFHPEMRGIVVVADQS